MNLKVATNKVALAALHPSRLWQKRCACWGVRAGGRDAGGPPPTAFQGKETRSGPSRQSRCLDARCLQGPARRELTINPFKHVCDLGEENSWLLIRMGTGCGDQVSGTKPQVVSAPLGSHYRLPWGTEEEGQPPASSRPPWQA